MSILAVTPSDMPAAAARSSARRPLWPWWVLLSAVIVFTMPAVHHRAFGTDRIQEATVQTLERMMDVHLGGGARATVRQNVAAQSPWAAGAGAAAATLLGVVVAGLFLSMASVLAGARLSAAQALGAAAVANLADVVMRVALWGLSLWSQGPDRAVTPSWPLGGAIGLDRLVGSGWGALQPLVYATDLTALVGTIAAALMLVEADRALSLPRAFAIAIVWPVLSILFRATIFIVMGVA